MGRTFLRSRWIIGLGSAAALLQVGTCQLNGTLANQFLVPEGATVFSDIVFFLLNNALVHLTT